MKLSLFLIIFSLLLSCSSSSADSEGETSDPNGALAEDRAGEGEPTEDVDTLGDGGDQPPSVQKKSVPAQVKRTGPCAKYPLSCGSDNELCGQKYLHCLRPKAGEPADTEQVVCQKEGNEITLVVNIWDHSAGQNNLLCDFWENTAEESALWAFATNQPKVCQNERDRKKAELKNTGYQCE